MLFPTRTLFRLLPYFLLIGLLATCRKKDEGFGPDGEPRILEMTLPGVPNGNLRIDQEAGQIFVTLPTDLPTLDFTPFFRFTPGSRLQKSPGDFDPFHFNVCASSNLPALTVITDGTKFKNYKLVLQSGEPLAFGALPQPFEVGLDGGSCLSLPILNFYDGSQNIAEVTFVRKDNGLRSTTPISCSPKGQPNQFSVCLPPDLTLGEYTLTLKKANGRTATAPHTLVVKKGLPHLGINGIYFYAPLIVGEKTPILQGSNVFEGDGFEAVLKNRNGAEYRVKPTNFQPTGRADFDLSGLPSGNYYVYLLQNGQLTSAKNRVIIIKDKNQPAIHFFKGLAGGYLEPLRFKRDQKEWFIFTPFGPYGKNPVTRLKFDPTIGGLAVLVDVKGHSNGGPDGGLPSFTLPATFPPGRYVLTLLIEQADGTVRESEPLERDVVVE